MALACLGQVKSRVKGHHVYDHNYKVNEKLECFLEPENEYSKNAIIVKSKDIVVRGGSRINFRVLQNFTKKIEHRYDVICRKIIDSARSKKVQF